MSDSDRLVINNIVPMKLNNNNMTHSFLILTLNKLSIFTPDVPVLYIEGKLQPKQHKNYITFQIINLY